MACINPNNTQLLVARHSIYGPLEFAGWVVDRKIASVAWAELTQVARARQCSLALNPLDSGYSLYVTAHIEGPLTPQDTLKLKARIQRWIDEQETEGDLHAKELWLELGYTARHSSAATPFLYRDGGDFIFVASATKCSSWLPDPESKLLVQIYDLHAQAWATPQVTCNNITEAERQFDSWIRSGCLAERPSLPGSLRRAA